MHDRILKAIALLLILTCGAGAQTKTSKGAKPPRKVVRPSTADSNAEQELIGKARLGAGKTQTIVFFDGAAEVTALRLKMEPADHYTLRQTLLRIYWDDAGTPAVEVPVGDFFGIPFAPVRFSSLYLRGEEAGYISTFPMRFRRRMRVELANRGKTPLDSVQWKLTYKPLASVPAPCAYLHAYWIHTQTKAGSPVEIWKASGSVPLLGTAFALQSVNSEIAPLVSEQTQVRLWSSNMEKPTLAATLPRFFDLGNPVFRDAISFPRSGATTIAQTIGRMAIYGFLDTAAFQSAHDARLDVTFPAAVDVAATTFWLQSSPKHDARPISDEQLKPARFYLHNVIEAESLRWDGGTPTKSEDTGFKAEASGGAVMALKTGTATASFPVAAEDVYVLNLAALLRPGATLKYRYALDGEPFSELYEASIDPLSAENTSLWITSIPIHLKAGTHKVALLPLGDKPLYLDYLELMPSQKVDGVVEVENLLEQAKFSMATKLARNDDSVEYSGSSFLQWENVTEGAELSVPIEFPKEGNYRLDLGIFRTVQGMKLTVKLDNSVIGEVDTFVSNADTNVLPMPVGKIKDISAGKHLLTLAAHAPKVGKSGTVHFDYYKITRLAD